ncbi:SpoIIE family protein phosphatase [Desulfurivibrio dismutans]|uniref:SpoIIE family protein phosphatase n=1 Tax=Desulfurivibrio dismutans TaxID=1398908 RepID=UPI0023DCE3B5|nr:SpoIIE family protein phosphatase [Desulfurivibrio alkaliphilus]MDF1614456.1 SpoIIE family protein phosphatase [Desulfurivibrio alkaliphilus]
MINNNGHEHPLEHPLGHPQGKRSGYLSNDGASPLTYSAPQILQAISDGVYVTDRRRRIVYWNQAAEKITGWAAGEVLGRSCYDNILCHVDKDGHQLCGEEYCPLHRAMRTGKASASPSLVFAQDKSGRRVPVMVNVSPIVDGRGEVIGGVEIFRDYSAEVHDQERARKIQSLSMQTPQGDTPGLQVAVKYLPHGMLGGDYYTMERLDEHRYAFCIADVMGHGTAAGLYAMHLHSLWENNRQVIDRPATFVSSLNRSLCSLVRDGESFATGLFGIIDLRAEALALCAAGSPSFVLYRGGRGRQIRLSSLPLGLVEDHVYEVTFLPLNPGDGLLFYTDGLTEVINQREEMLGGEGLLTMVNQLGFPADEEAMDHLAKKVLQFSNQIRFPDDVTMLAMQYTGRTTGADKR